VKDNLPDWTRDHFERGDSHALLLLVVYGEFTDEPQISRSAYRTDGIPHGFDLQKITRVQSPILPFADPEFGQGVHDQKLFKQIGLAPECLVLRGEIPDPENLNYLRDSVGMMSYFLHHGGFAVCDPQQLALFNRDLWQLEVFEPGMAGLGKHVMILYSDESDGRWFHTRGLRKFARPDLSVRGVPAEYSKTVIELCNRFIRMQQLGARIPEGQEIRMASLPPGLICHHRGNLDDPDFNNVHVEIRWPDGKA